MKIISFQEKREVKSIGHLFCVLVLDQTTHLNSSGNMAVFRVFAIIGLFHQTALISEISSCLQRAMAVSKQRPKQIQHHILLRLTINLNKFDKNWTTFWRSVNTISELCVNVRSVFAGAEK